MRNRQSPTVLVVDDDEAQLTLLGAVLRKNGYTVRLCSDAVQALETLKSTHVDAVLSDWMMPHLDGVEFTERIHQLPQHAEVPVILMTAYPSGALSETGMRRGVAMTLSKPVELNRMLELVAFATRKAE
jgi:two-component system, chemotaxis family, chemotaxis protein CheY